jgi:glycosyltransferase involved in cell wall biosynthesis
MKVSFLVPDLGWPIVGIAARMARYLAGTHDVEIVGPSLWGGANAMYSAEFTYRKVDCPRIYRYPEYFREVRKLSHALQGDVVIAMKAFGSTLPAALRAKQERGCRVVAYLDEWDGAVAASWSPGERIRQWARDWMHPCNNVHVPRMERLLPQCDLRLVTTRFLERKFDGTRFQIGVDTERFQPQDPARVAALKDRLGLHGMMLAVFGGIVRQHKGVEVFAEALARLARDDVRLIILGPLNDHVRDMMAHPVYGRLVVSPAVDGPSTQAIHRDMPLYLGLGDVLMVPLTDNLLAQSQMPCKVFEAMAMGKPIVATAISDLPEVLEGCGHLVEPGRVESVVSAVDAVLSDPAGAHDMGQRARQRCLEQFSAAASRTALLEMLDGLR